MTPRRYMLAGVTCLLFLWLGWERCGIAGCPNVARLSAYQPGGAAVLLDRHGDPFADLAPVERAIVPLDSLPPYVAAAFLAVEDKRFYDHDGVDWRRIPGAALANLRAGAFAQGFSTITMQLARNVFSERLPGSERTVWRKLLEIRVAREIEAVFSKPEILELYLNHIYFGGGAYGVQAAAREYFGVPARRLTLAQAALLAALPKAPTNYDPRRHPERARERRGLVLALMAEQGRITAAEAELAREAPLGVLREPPPRERDVPFAPYFVESVRSALENRFEDRLYTAPLRIYTTLDPVAQRAAEQALERQLRAAERGAFGPFDAPHYAASRKPEPDGTGYLQGAAVVLEAGTGDVLAMVGGRDFRDSRYNRATRARRQVGSAFKPFVYAAALAEGYAPSQRIADAPIAMELEGGEVWEPQNLTGEFEGTVTLREALVRSKNVPTIRLAGAVGLDDVADVAERAGIHSPIPDLPSMAIGTAALSLLELTAAYSAFAGMGDAVEPRLVLRVEDEDGEVLWESEVERHRALDPAVAYLLTDLLADAVDHGTGAAVRDAGFHGPAAGKTGTTDRGTDAWFIGYTPDVVAGVWIGFDHPRTIAPKATGGRIAAPAWARIVDAVYQERELPQAWPRPDEVVELPIDPETGLVLADGCRPERGQTERELFIRGMQPAAVCPRGEPGEDGPGVFDRVYARARALWHGAEVWVADLFGDPEDPAERRERERYLGAPRLPRAEEVETPAVDPDSFENRRPGRVDSLDGAKRDTIEILLPDPDTGLLGVPFPRPGQAPGVPQVPGGNVPRGPPAGVPPIPGGRPMPGDTVLLLVPGDSGATLEPAIVRPPDPPPR